MYYNLTLKKPTGITHAVVGSFSSSSKKEIVVSKGRFLELWEFIDGSHELPVVSSVDVFGEIRSIKAFRPAGRTRDCLVLGSYSGNIIILQYDSESKAFKKIFEEVCSKNRRASKIVGQYIAVDPRGHAVMIGALEDLKCAVTVENTADDNLTFSSVIPVEKAYTLMYDMVGVDEGSDKYAAFVCLEANHREADPLQENDVNIDQQELKFYKLNLTSKEIDCISVLLLQDAFSELLLDRYTYLVDDRTNKLVSVPGGSVGPGGVLVLSENRVSYVNQSVPAQILVLTCKAPRRICDLGSLNRSLMFVCCSLSSAEPQICFIAQTEFGDIFQIKLEVVGGRVVEIMLKYLDQIPLATELCIIQPSFLFAASEFGNHTLYRLTNPEEILVEPVFSSAIPGNKRETDFYPFRKVKCLDFIREVQSLSPIMHCEAAKVSGADGRHERRLYVACGRGPRSTLRVLKQGCELSDKFTQYHLPDVATGIWTLKITNRDYIVVSFQNSTQVFQLGESIEKVAVPCIEENANTLSCRIMDDNVFVHISTEKITCIRLTEDGDSCFWEAPKENPIVLCDINNSQIVVVLFSGAMIYLEQNLGKLMGHRTSKTMPSPVRCMALSGSENDSGLAAFCAVGLELNTLLCILSLNTENMLEPVFSTTLPEVPTSFLFTKVGASVPSAPQLLIGFQDGSVLISQMSPDSGQLADCKLQQLDSEPVQMFEFQVKGKSTVMIMSTHTWLYSQEEDEDCLLRLANGKPGIAFCVFGQWPDTFLAASKTLRVLNIGESFEEESLSLDFTPRKFVLDSDSGYMFIIETDHNAATKITRDENMQFMEKEIREAEKNEELADLMVFLCCTDEYCEGIPAGHQMWASTIRIVDHNGKEVYSLPLEQNKAAFSIAVLHQGDKRFLFVGLTRDMKYNGLVCRKGILQIYEIQANITLRLIHEVDVKGAPMAMHPFGSNILIGIGKCLKLYKFENNKLSIVSENECVQNHIISIIVKENNIIVGDQKANLVYLKYEGVLDGLQLYSRDKDLSYLTTTCLLDSEHIARADKYGNLFIVKLPTGFFAKSTPESSPDVWDELKSPNAEVIATFYLGEMVLSMQKTCLFEGGLDVLMYTTLSGTIGVIGELSEAEETFVEKLEKILPPEIPAICGLDHFTFRSYLHCAKNIIDGDFCEQFQYLDYEAQTRIASIMEVGPYNIKKSLREIRSNFIF